MSRICVPSKGRYYSVNLAVFAHTYRALLYKLLVYKCVMLLCCQLQILYYIIGVRWKNGHRTLVEGCRLGTRGYSEKTHTTAPLCPKQTPHGLSSNRSWTSAVRGPREPWHVIRSISQTFPDITSGNERAKTTTELEATKHGRPNLLSQRTAQVIVGLVRRTYVRK